MKAFLEKNSHQEDVEFVQKKLRKYNEKFTEPDNYKKLNIFIRDDEGIIKGGLLAGTFWKWLCVDILWIDEHFRNKGYGKKLLEKAEKEALKRGCHNAFLDTHDFQAVNFYKKNGYEICGQLDDLPEGYNRYLLKKELV